MQVEWRRAFKLLTLIYFNCCTFVEYIRGIIQPTLIRLNSPLLVSMGFRLNNIDSLTQKSYTSENHGGTQITEPSNAYSQTKHCHIHWKTPVKTFLGKLANFLCYVWCRMCQQVTHRADRNRLIRLACALEIMVTTLVTAYRAMCKLTKYFARSKWA